MERLSSDRGGLKLKLPDSLSRERFPGWTLVLVDRCLSQLLVFDLSNSSAYPSDCVKNLEAHPLKNVRAEKALRGHLGSERGSHVLEVTQQFGSQLGAEPVSCLLLSVRHSEGE